MILTDIALPGAIADGDPAMPEIVIRRSGPHSGGDDAGRTLWREGGALRFEPHRVAAYQCAAPGCVEVSPCPEADEAEVAALLIATALPGLMWLRGAFMLHASAAVMPGQERAVAIAAPSGAGKSAMLAEMVARGARIVADDSLALHPVGGALMAGGLAGGYFAHHPDPAARPFVPVVPAQAGEVPLGIILVLSRHGADTPASLSRLAPLDALSAILSNRHRPAIPALFGEPGRRLADAVRIARTPAFRWSRPDGAIRLTTPEWSDITRLCREADHD